jgi:hypothetical protein
MKIGMPTREVRLSVGGRPQVNLLPDEVRSARRVRRVRRVMVGAVVASVVVAAAGCGGAFLVERHAAGQMVEAQQQANALQGAQAQFSGVTAVRRGLASSVAARRTAAVRMIDGEAYMDGLAASLPKGLSIGSIAVDSTVPSPTATAGTASPQAGTGLTGAYVATVTVHVLTTRLATVQTWLGSLTTLKGYVDASPGAVSTASAGGLDVAVTLHLNAKAYTTPAGVGASTATDTASTSASPASSNGEQQ